MGIWMHSVHSQVWDTVFILEEGKLSHPRCPLCEILLLWAPLNGRHLNTVLCSKGSERKCHRLAVEADQEVMETQFRVYG